MHARKTIKRIFRGLGFDVIRYSTKSHFLARRKKILDLYEINLVLDVGANIGQYGDQLREIGYRGRIISFEPLSSAFKELQARARNDQFWEVYNFALGEQEGTAPINVAGNSVSSSLLEMLPSHLKAAPTSKYIRQEEIQIKTLDSIFSSLSTSGDNIYLKIDTQGFEKNVIKGAENSLQCIDLIQLEISLSPLYQDQPSFDEILQLLGNLGYQVIMIEPGFIDQNTGHMLQVDGIFHRL